MSNLEPWQLMRLAKHSKSIGVSNEMLTKSEDNGNLVSSSRHFLGKMEESEEYKYSTKIPNRGKPSTSITEEALLPLNEQ